MTGRSRVARGARDTVNTTVIRRGSAARLRARRAHTIAFGVTDTVAGVDTSPSVTGRLAFTGAKGVRFGRTRCGSYAFNACIIGAHTIHGGPTHTSFAFLQALA
jgi:hypothetical protein